MQLDLKDKLTFRPLELSDMSIRTKWLKNPVVRKNLGWQIRRGTSLKEQKQWFTKYQEDSSDQRFMIAYNDRPIGMVGLTDINPVDKNAMLYVVIGEDDYRGRGIGRRACEYIIDYGFKKLKLHKIWLEVNGYNEIGINLYKSLGFVEEGRLKDQIFIDGKYHDQVYMGLIKS